MNNITVWRHEEESSRLVFMINGNEYCLFKSGTICGIFFTAPYEWTREEL